MKEIELDARLGAIAARTLECRHVADIGADHGLLACYLLKSNPTMTMTVSDVSAPSLSKARALLAQQGLAARAHFCVADGLSGLEQEADAIVIAGMGAKTIREILTAGRERIGSARLLLQPNLDVPRLRGYLAQAGFAVIEETAVSAAGRHYMIIEARLESDAPPRRLSDREAFLGERLQKKRDAHTHAFYAWQYAVREGELKRLEALDVHTDPANARRETLERELSWLREVL